MLGALYTKPVMIHPLRAFVSRRGASYNNLLILTYLNTNFRCPLWTSVRAALAPFLFRLLARGLRQDPPGDVTSHEGVLRPGPETVTRARTFDPPTRPSWDQSVARHTPPRGVRV